MISLIFREFLSSRQENKKAGDEHTAQMTFDIAHQLSNGTSQWHRPLINLNLSSVSSGSLSNNTFFG